MHTYILLDRTGSMSRIWDEALSSVNAYAASVAEPDEGEPQGHLDTRITAAVFDAQEGLQFDVLRRNVAGVDWQEITSREASPRGMTPLFDAIARIIALAEGDGPDKAVIVIMTDGHENASREVTLDGVKAALDRVKARGWETVFLGANFGEFADAERLGVAGAQTMAMSSGSMGASMSRLAKKSRRYAQLNEKVAFSAEDRQEAGEDQVRKT